MKRLTLSRQRCTLTVNVHDIRALYAGIDPDMDEVNPDMDEVKQRP
jgi:hypothetical protein